MIPVLALPINEDEAIASGWNRKIGDGSFRSVYINDDDPTVVLKIGHRGCGGHEHNKRECELWEAHAETAFGFSITPILGRNEDYTGILMKRMPCFDWASGTEQTRQLARDATSREILQVWHDQHEDLDDDFHTGNWGYIADDYGFYTPGRIVDYAGA